MPQQAQSGRPRSPVFAPALRPFPAQIWEFSDPEGKSLETNIIKRERESAHRIRLESAEGKTRLCPKYARWRAGGGGARVAFLKALALSAARRATEDERRRPARWVGAGRRSVGLRSVCVCVSAPAPVCVRVSVCLAPVQGDFP